MKKLFMIISIVLVVFTLILPVSLCCSDTTNSSDTSKIGLSDKEIRDILNGKRINCGYKNQYCNKTLIIKFFKEILEDKSLFVNNNTASKNKKIKKAVDEMVKNSQKNIEQAIQFSNPDVKDLFGKEITSGKNYVKEMIKNSTTFPHLYVFISSSMPIATLENYAQTVSKLKGEAVMVMRGFIGNGTRIKPTLEFFKKIFNENEKYYITIDPSLFDYFQINRVPVLVLVNENGLEKLLFPSMQGEKMKTEDFCLIKGDVSIQYFLDKCAGYKSLTEIAQKLIKILRME